MPSYYRLLLDGKRTIGCGIGRGTEAWCFRFPPPAAKREGSRVRWSRLLDLMAEAPKDLPVAFTGEPLAQLSCLDFDALYQCFGRVIDVWGSGEYFDGGYLSDGARLHLYPGHGNGYSAPVLLYRGAAEVVLEWTPALTAERLARIASLADACTVYVMCPPDREEYVVKRVLDCGRSNVRLDLGGMWF